MALPDYEKLGVFYLGREFNPEEKAPGPPLLYDSRDLTTHAVCIGMTGSGKTGLCLSLLEEAALDAVPAIVIDPKGDLGNLLLTFPELQAADFEPWVDPGEAARKGQGVADFAAATAETWRKGLAEWGQDGERIRRLRAAADISIYTPGSEAGKPLSVLRSFAAPAAGVLDDATALKERIAGSVSGLLGLLGIEADPIRSREHILLAAILDTAWRRGESLDLASLIGQVQRPPFDKVGVFDVESFFPAKDRTELALRINGLLASPGFAAWLAGEPLDIQRLLHTPDGKPRISIISIAHLNDAERMFVVTLVANELVAWMRRQSGTTSLRAIFYMDEIVGFLPAGRDAAVETADADADEAGAGLWHRRGPRHAEPGRSRLQGTRQRGHLVHRSAADRARPRSRHRGPARHGGRQGPRPRGPHVDDGEPDAAHVPDAQRPRRCTGAVPHALGDVLPARPADARGNSHAFGLIVAAGWGVTGGGRAAWRFSHQPARAAALPPRGHARGRSSRPGSSSDFGLRMAVTRPRTRRTSEHGSARTSSTRRRGSMPGSPVTTSPPPMARARTGPRRRCSMSRGSSCATHPRTGRVSRTPQGPCSPREPTRPGRLPSPITSTALRRCRCSGVRRSSGRPRRAAPRAISAPCSRRTCASAVTPQSTFCAAGTRRDLRRSRTGSVAREQKVERERAQAQSETTSSVLTVGGSVLGALFGGRRAGAFSKASTAARRIGRISKERADVAHAEADAGSLREQEAAVESELEAEIAASGRTFDPATIAVESVPVQPRKSDLAVEDMALVWSA